MDLAAQLMHPPDDTMDIIGQLTNLVSLDISPNKWKFSLQQLQQLSGCCKLTELVVAQLAMGFAEPGRIDDNGIEVGEGTRGGGGRGDLVWMVSRLRQLTELVLTQPLGLRSLVGLMMMA
jgi:hypothetical protein